MLKVGIAPPPRSTALFGNLRSAQNLAFATAVSAVSGAGNTEISVYAPYTTAGDGVMTTNLLPVIPTDTGVVRISVTTKFAPYPATLATSASQSGAQEPPADEPEKKVGQ